MIFMFIQFFHPISLFAQLYDGILVGCYFVQSTSEFEEFARTCIFKK